MAVKINISECRRCMACVDTCKYGALKEGDDGPIIDKNKCTECGACISVCPARCIER